MNKEAFDTALQLASTRLRKAAEADPFPDVPNVNNTQPNFNAPATSGPATNWSAKPGMRMQMSPHAALRRGARAAGNAVGQFAQAPANYMGQVGQSIGSAFNRATGQQPVAPQAAQQQPNTPWMQNPRVGDGAAKMPNRPGQYAGTNQLNSNYSGNGVQTAERRSQPRPDYTQPFVRNPNFRGGVTNTPTQFAPGQTRQQTIDRLLKRSSTSGGYLQQARNGARSVRNTASNLPAAPAQQMGVTMANTFNRGAKGVANMMSASPIAAMSRWAGNMFSRRSPATPSPTASTTAASPVATPWSQAPASELRYRDMIHPDFTNGSSHNNSQYPVSRFRDLLHPDLRASMRQNLG